MRTSRTAHVRDGCVSCRAGYPEIQRGRYRGVQQCDQVRPPAQPPSPHNSDTLMTTVLPAARAGVTFQTNSARGGRRVGGGGRGGEGATKSPGTSQPAGTARLAAECLHQAAPSGIIMMQQGCSLSSVTLGAIGDRCITLTHEWEVPGSDLQQQSQSHAA